MRLIPILLCLSLLMCGPLAQAASLGKVTVPLADRSSGSIKAAEQKALTQLLVRLTGQQDVASIAGASELLEQPQKQLFQYGYGKTDDGQLTLVTHFDVKSLTQALLDAGASVWTLSRPPLLLWVVAPDGQLLAADAVLEKKAKQRGLPLLLPTDMGDVMAADIRGRFMQPVLQASKAYGTDLIATAVIYDNSVRWWLYQGNKLLDRGQGQAVNAEGVRRLLINQLTDAVVKRYAVTGGGASHYLIRVSGVEAMGDWLYLKRSLEDIAGVEQLLPASLTADIAAWKLSFSGAPDQLNRLLGINRHLRACESQAQPVTPSAAVGQMAPANQPVAPVATILDYCWQP